MARREDGAGPMNAIIAGFVGLLVVVAIVILGPVLAGSIQSAVPAMSPASPWNTSNASLNIPNGVALWTQSVTLGGLVILVFFIALAIYYIRVIA